MSAYPVTDERYPSVYQRTFTSFASPVLLHSTNAPTNAQYLPSALVVNADTGDVLAWTDVDDVTNTITFAAPWFGTLRIAAKTLTTATTVVSVTALWNGAGPYGGAG